jgi:redox-sensitive bicupin YhaK (pirin superfamily)
MWRHSFAAVLPAAYDDGALKVAAEEFAAQPCPDRTIEKYPSRETSLGSLKIWRALPRRGRRLIGPWCFLDRYGPLSFGDSRPMDVAPHPHIGLQTVSWLLEGEVLHRDSLGLEAMVRPGGVNVMTAGRGIAHSEETPVENSGRLNGVQLWVAMPDADRQVAPSFDHAPSVPRIELPGGALQLFIGSMEGETATAPRYSDILGGEIAVHPKASTEFPLDPSREHGIFVFEGDAAMEGEDLSRNVLYYLATGRSSVTLRSREGSRLLLIGGLPFPEPVLMWWNFVAREPEEIIAARQGWESGEMFGPVLGYSGPRLHAPSLMKLARPNPAS